MEPLPTHLIFDTVKSIASVFHCSFPSREILYDFLGLVGFLGVVGLQGADENFKF